jgi:hypothetical protein
VSTPTLQSVKSNESSARETARPERERSYHEMPGLRHETRDVLKQLDANIQLLEDLGGRLSFVMNEVRGTMRR